ncbi:MAG: N-6 DNA methylase [Actinomycetota bacterium]
MSRDTFTTVRVAGGILPPDLLTRLTTAKEVEGLAPVDYHLAPGETLREAANRAWSYLTGVWASYKSALDKLPPEDRATSLTRERWLLLLFKELDFGRLPATSAGGLTAEGKGFPISHHWGNVPAHLLGYNIELDSRSTGVVGAAGASPQSLVQEYLNRTDEALWGILSNGRTLRLLRDSTSLVGSAYVEFDLEAIFDGDQFSDFLLLYLMLHQSRFESPEENPAECWLERWRTQAIETGTRALDQLRDGVAEALETLGSGFLSHPSNHDLRQALKDGSLDLADYRRALLRLVYRLLFLFVAEARSALFEPDAGETSKRRYLDFYSVAHLRRISLKRLGSSHGDLWHGLRQVLRALGNEAGHPQLGLPALGGIFEHTELDVVDDHELSNHALLEAVRALSTVRDRTTGPTRTVDFRNLDAEELGSIYESLLELIPSHDPATNQFKLRVVAGNERKTSGSYYTPTSLIESLLDTALDPLIEEAENAEDSERALLEITVCDPACGSGHFLVAAARRIAKRLAAVRTGDPEPGPEPVRTALRDVVTSCIYGVDVNPLAAELAKVSLWLEALEPGRPGHSPSSTHRSR